MVRNSRVRYIFAKWNSPCASFFARFSAILEDAKEKEKEKKIKKKEKNCTEEDAGTVCKYRNVSFLVCTFRLPASSRPDGLSLSSCNDNNSMECQEGKKRGKKGDEEDELRAEGGTGRERQRRRVVTTWWRLKHQRAANFTRISRSFTTS